MYESDILLYVSIDLKSFPKEMERLSLCFRPIKNAGDWSKGKN
jgi:hypothetical protein